jgi:hypothetical protein
MFALDIDFVVVSHFVSFAPKTNKKIENRCKQGKTPGCTSTCLEHPGAMYGYAGMGGMVKLISIAFLLSFFFCLDTSVLIC